METKGRPKVASLGEALMHACGGIHQAHLEMKGGEKEETEVRDGGWMGQMDAAPDNPESFSPSPAIPS